MAELTRVDLLYHEVQREINSKLCVVHCLNAALQGPFFSFSDLTAIANRGGDGGFTHDVPVVNHNFNIHVMERALRMWDLQVIPFGTAAANASRLDPHLENAFICHASDNHWFCIRKVNRKWYNFNSRYAAPEYLSRTYLCELLDMLETSFCSIFVVWGEFPKECPIQSANAFGKWLLPENAQMRANFWDDMQAPQWNQGSEHPSSSFQFGNMTVTGEPMDLDPSTASDKSKMSQDDKDQ